MGKKIGYPNSVPQTCSNTRETKKLSQNKHTSFHDK